MNTNNTYKRVPFDIELAKKIQSGEVEGKIIINGDILDTSRWTLDTNPVDNKLEIIDGKYNKCVASLKDNNELFIELPEETPKHKYIYEFNENPKKLLHTEKIEQVATKITVDGFVVRNRYGLTDFDRTKHEFKVGDKVRVNYPRGIKGAFQGKTVTITKVSDSYVLAYGNGIQETCFTFNEIEPYEEKHEFKPFDKVLVRQDSKETWLPNFYYKKLHGRQGYEMIGCSVFAQCIPYEGNEHLIGTTNNPLH